MAPKPGRRTHVCVVSKLYSVECEVNTFRKIDIPAPPFLPAPFPLLFYGKWHLYRLLRAKEINKWVPMRWRLCLFLVCHGCRYGRRRTALTAEQLSALTRRVSWNISMFRGWAPFIVSLLRSGHTWGTICRRCKKRKKPSNNSLHVCWRRRPCRLLLVVVSLCALSS